MFSSFAAYAAEPTPVGVAAANSVGEDSATAFDLEALKSRGIDPAVAAYFSKKPRFHPGRTRVALVLNGKPKGSVTARFDEKGNLCFDRAFIDQAGLILPAALERDAKDDSATPAGCYDYRDAYPQTETTLDPNKNEISLVVPSDALREEELNIAHSSGGVGAMLNYDIVSTKTQSLDTQQNFTYANTEVGFNAGDWMVRSRQSYSSDRGEGRFQYLYSYAQKTFVEQRALLQVGEINANSTLFALPSLIGAQWFPDSALTPQNSSGSIDGVANSQARVEVRQLGAIIYSTMVPGGPFSLKDVPLLNTTAEVEVTITEASGGQQRYSLPASQVQSWLGAPQRLSMAAGLARETGNGDRPWVITATDGRTISKRLNVGGGVLAARGYQAAVVTLASEPIPGLSGTATTTFSNAQQDGQRGAKVDMNVYGALPAYQLSANAYAIQQTRGYRDLTDVIGATSDANSAPAMRSQYGISATWQNATLGGFTMAYSQSSYFNGSSSRRMMAAWSKQVKRTTLSVNVERNLGGYSLNGKTRVYAMLSFPLGSASARTYVNTSGNGETKYGAAASQTVSDYLNYNVSADTSSRGTPNFSGNVSVLPRYTQAGFGYARSGTDSNTFSAQLQGGVVATRAGITPSPHQIGDTFGMISADGESGVRISTPQGTVWTDPWGHAAIPNLPAFKTSRVEVVTKSLPRSIDVKNGISMLNAGRGSVNLVDFGMVRVRRMLLDTKLHDGTPLPSRSMILDGEGNYVTTSVDDGVVFLDTVPKSSLHATKPDGGICRLDFSLPEKQDTERPYESVEAKCAT
ncbi:fimbria/pilus outer membrane usher protein [Andreprevotia chitinilytica]|uniref:fimbria/pilus outer membrane usher protein n=1 Tax=Andreprevotia chitinilytica TaxID=396808 RepID=UPI00069098AA|nr:fimbria/pilus outer membrane usher protein [Andreprevotia chitinilytica]